MATRLRAGSRVPAGADRDCPDTCPTRQTLARLADRWTILLLERLTDGPRRFGQLRDGTPGISEKMLAQTLRGLERDGLVVSGGGYALTELGRSLLELGRSLLEPLEAVRAWGRAHMDAIERARAGYDTR